MNKKEQYFFEALFRSQYRKLYLHALSFVRNEEEAKDIVNDTFEYLWNNYHRLDFADSIVPLLYKIVRSRCMDFLRHKKTKERFVAYGVSHFSEVAETNSQEYEALIQRITTLIEQFPPQTQAVFKLCFIEKKTYRDAGALLNISENTVRTHIAKALRILRNHFPDKEMLILCFLLRKRMRVEG